MFKHIYIVFISSCFLINGVWAQTDTATLENETIDIIKDYEPVVKRANKKNFAPKTPEIVIDKPNNQNYNLPISYQEVEYEPSELRPLGYPKEDEVSLPFMYLKAGFGNYITPLIDFQVTNKNTENFRVGLGLQHLSSRRKKIENQKFGETDIKLLGEYYLNGMTIGAQPYFNINTYHYYGYDQEDTTFTADETRNRYNKGGVKFFLFNHEENRIGLDYNTAVTFHSTTDDYNNKEINFNWDMGVSKTFREIFKVGGNVMMNVNSFKGIANENRFALGINPYLEVGKDRWFVRGGFWFLTDEGTVYALPDIKHQTKLYKDYIVIYNEWIGNLEINNLNTLSETNPWLAQSINYNNYRVEARNFIGFKGNVPVGIDYDVRFSQMVYYDVPLFVNDTSTVFNKFMVQYDNKLKAWNPHISLGYQLGEFLKIRTSFDYFSYSTSDLINEAPWHLPEFKANASAIFQYNNKFIFKADVIGFSGVKVKNDEGDVEKLKGNVDLNFSANYLLNKNISFFAEVNNALSLKSERWYKYPGYGFLALGGVIVSF
ncbi:MAG: hypothetical protein R2728_10405 [Chitinophagales bacterium]